MSESNEKFLARWSRLKQEEIKAQPPTQPQPVVDANAPPPELPPIEKLTINSDYTGFFHPKVDKKLRQAALRKLFSDPHFNVMDGLDVYIDDYSKSDPLPAEMLAQLKHGQQILAWAREDTEKTAAQEAAAAAASSQPALLEEGQLPLPHAVPLAAPPVAVPASDQHEPAMPPQSRSQS